MGTRGPIPHRSDQRVRRNQDEGPIEKISTIGPVRVPELGIAYPHQLVSDMYESLKDSAQSRYYEPSDWQYARLCMYLLNDMLSKERISSVMVASVNQMLTALLMTEGDRRRVRLEVERNQNAGGAKVLDIADLFKQQLEMVASG